MAKKQGNNRKLSLEDARAVVDRLEPDLTRTDWPPITSMGIPSMLESARTLARDLGAQSKAEDSPELRALSQRLRKLIDDRPHAQQKSGGESQ